MYSVNIPTKSHRRDISCHFLRVPLRVSVRLGEFDEDGEAENWPFRKVVGRLIWLVISTRPNVSNTQQNYVWRCMSVLVFQDAGVAHLFYV